MTARAVDAALRTLTIDIGGTGIKTLPLNDEGEPLAERVRVLTPKPSTPDRVLGVIKQMIDAQEPFARVSVGFPGVVMRGVVKTGPNMGTEAWRGIDLQSAIAEYTGKPVRVINDADLQGYGVIVGEGVEIVLTLGTGLGTGLYVNGHLVPNLELAHHPLTKNNTYEDLVSDAELKRVGKKAVANGDGARVRDPRLALPLRPHARGRRQREASERSPFPTRSACSGTSKA